MGGGNWDAATYDSTTGATLRSGGSGFAYHDTVASRSADEWKAHETLDPHGIVVREARDSDEHPNATPIAVLFDVTGSMGVVPKELQARLPDLLGALQFSGAVPDPQIMFGAIGDATSDRVPFQVGQFESDNRLDENLANMFLEGNGGGQNCESYEIAFWFMANKVVTDAWEKRGHKGYLIMVGDEHPYPAVNPRHIERIFGDEIDEGASIESLIEAVQEKWEVWFLIPEGHGYGIDRHSGLELHDHWKQLLGDERVIIFQPADAAETISKLLGAFEEATQP